MSLFIITGEPSGDLHAGHLIEKLKEKNPGLKIEGVAGPHMRSQGVTGPLSMEDFLVMGFTDVLVALPKLYRHFHTICRHIISTQPSGVVFVDYPGLNIRLAKALRKKGYKGKLIHYISPTVWAHGKHRADVMAKYLDLLITIYPFEAALYAHTPLLVEYVGNPLCNYVDAYSYDPAWKAEQNIVGIFPGSREQEVQRNLPVILEAAHKFLQKHPKTLFSISCASEPLETVIKKMLAQKVPNDLDKFVCVPKQWTYELMKSCRCAIAKSGTVTLELAFHGIPTVVVYQLTPLNRFIAKHILRLKLHHYCIVNILGDDEIFPELIAEAATPEKLLSHLDTLYSNDIVRKQKIQACHLIHKRLGNGNANANAADAILRTIA